MSVPRFWRRLKNVYNLIGTQCENCGMYYYPPRSLCPKCRRSSLIIPFKFKGEGEVLTYTIVHSATKDFEKHVPYILAIIKLNEGPNLTSQVICSPEEIHIGMKVKSVFRKLGEESEKGMIYYGTKFVPLLNHSGK
ncbi:MAG TPA: Zn-ribbon domain-containing OB-fold protein [Candidatus Methanoperedens sp.]|nr:Zn-ribbon domain-containing OB-fold protein [Candidatus Methanoperedens sp.]HLB71587.1 Zn-ribbon domain-containing OB-fold protein [Candidatus Methanoperedens sp.]